MRANLLMLSLLVTLMAAVASLQRQPVPVLTASAKVSSQELRPAAPSAEPEITFLPVRGFEEAPGGQVKVVKPNLLFRKMKLRDGDILVEVNGTQMHSLENLGNELWTWPGPRSFDFIVSRQGKRLRFVTKIEALVKDPEIVAWVEAARAQEEAREKTSPRRK
jgi:S1-C subfamily serine protease